MIGRRSLVAGTALGVTFGTGYAAPKPPAEGSSVVAETHRGKVRGTIEDGIRVFRGIPYGASTAGTARFRPAAQPIAWTGVRDAVAYGPMCPQLPGERTSITASWTYEKDMSEDCLVLNVWTPALRDHVRRPVMLWLHGGGFSSLSGSRNVFDGGRLCRRGDVVVVTLNHRLNLFGHLYLAQLAGGDYADSGNVGLLDIITALRWVHETIREFGGDAGNVTIFGQSGGGAKVSTLMAMPQARGLFHRAIVESGSHLEGLTPDEATRHATALLAALGLQGTEATKLHAIPTTKLLQALKGLMAGPSPPHFSPVVDGRRLPKGPWLPEAPAISANVPLLVGTTRTETTALIGGSDPATFTLDAAGLRGKLARWVPASDVERVIAQFRALTPDASPSDLFFAITTDRRARQQAWLQAEKKSAQGGAAIWLYELDWSTPVEGGKWRSPHSLDLAFVFDNVAKSTSMVGTGPEPQMLADQMSAAWLAFARSGDPNTPALPHWPPFRVPERATMVFDVTPKVVNDFRGSERTVLGTLPPYRVTR
jgi:para-nitrobenzyl esterase